MRPSPGLVRTASHCGSRRPDAGWQGAGSWSQGLDQGGDRTGPSNERCRSAVPALRQKGFVMTVNQGLGRVGGRVVGVGAAGRVHEATEPGHRCETDWWLTVSRPHRDRPRRPPSMIRRELVAIAVLGSSARDRPRLVFGISPQHVLTRQGIPVRFATGPQLISCVVLAALAGVLAALFPARRVTRMDFLRAITTERPMN